MNAKELQEARDGVAVWRTKGPVASLAADIVDVLLDHIDLQATRLKKQGKVINDLQKANCPCRVEKMEQIATLKAALIKGVAQSIFYSPDEDGHLPIFDFDELSSDTADGIRERATDRLAQKMPEIFGEDR